MPKIIENLKEKLLEEAKKQIWEKGYAKTTVRSIARACGVGTGTVYNYFPSKDMLIASFMSADWKACLENMRARADGEPEEVLRAVYESLRLFIDDHAPLLTDRDASESFNSAYSSYHGFMRKQIAEILEPMCGKAGEGDPFFPVFVAESLIIWTVGGKNFEEQYSVLKRLFD